MIEIRHLKTLVALRDTGSLVDAAERVHLTQSALSHQLKDLEDRLDCKIFVRKTKPPRFTSAGRRLLALADELLPTLDQAERDIARLSGGKPVDCTLLLSVTVASSGLCPVSINSERIGQKSSLI